MLTTLIPLFDENMSVRAYSLFTQKLNYLMEPRYYLIARLDGSNSIEGMEVIENVGMDALSAEKDIFVPISNVSLFANISETCSVKHGCITLLMDNEVKPTEMYTTRLKELKDEGYKLAIRKIRLTKIEEYAPILELIDYFYMNMEKDDARQLKAYMQKNYPNVALVAGNICSKETFDMLSDDGGYSLFEGSFYRMPVTVGNREIAPLKITYLELLNTVNNPDFDLADAADIIGRDTALVISMLKMVNNMTYNSQITTIRHAVAMLGQKELRRWTSTAITKQLCKDKPSEIMRLSLIRAKFAENLADTFGLSSRSSELFLMGLFSVLDIILDRPMSEALQNINVSQAIQDALISDEGDLAPVLDFIRNYESADWTEVFRIMILKNIQNPQIYAAFKDSLEWYQKLIAE